MMSSNRYFVAPILALGVLAAGCDTQAAESGDVASGVLYSVSYTQANGQLAGFTRVNSSRAVPGGNGAWNIDATGRLTRYYLIVTRPQRKDLGPEIIPASRLVDVQFGDGGIKQVEETHGAP